MKYKGILISIDKNINTGVSYITGLKVPSHLFVYKTYAPKYYADLECIIKESKYKNMESIQEIAINKEGYEILYNAMKGHLNLEIDFNILNNCTCGAKSIKSNFHSSWCDYIGT